MSASERRIAQLEHALLTALLKIEESDDSSDQEWTRLIRQHFGFPERNEPALGRTPEPVLGGAK